MDGNLPEFLPKQERKIDTTRNGKLPIFYDKKVVFYTENVEMELFQRVQKTPTQGFCLDLVWNTRETIYGHP